MSEGDQDARDDGRFASEAGKKSFWRVIDPEGLYERLGAWLLAGVEVLGWYQRAELTGYSMKKRERDWFLIVRANVKGKKKVAFYSGHNPADCIKAFALDIKRNFVSWKDDLY